MAKKMVDEMWAGFRQSPVYGGIAQYPDMLVQATLTYFEEMAVEVSNRPFTQWDARDIEALLTELIDQARTDSDEEAEAILTMTYGVIRAFLRYLVTQGDLRLAAQALEALLSRIEATEDLGNPDDVMIEDSGDDGPMGTNIQTDGLPQWQARTAQDIDRYTQKWVAVYATDQTAWHQRPQGVTRDFLETIVAVLTEQAYNQFRKTPKTWTKRAIGAIFAGEFVTNLALDDQEYALVAPALSHWIAYVAQRGWLNAKRAASYQRYFTATAPKMVELAADLDNFNPAKMLAYQLRQHGIDPEDDQAVQAFIQEVNQNGGLDTLYQSGLAPKDRDELSGFTPKEVQTLLASDELMDELVTMYDPDEQGEYLQVEHAKVPGKPRWTRATAKRVHREGVVLGIRLWLQRRQYQLTAGWDSAVVIGNVSDFTDEMYAQNRETPADWTPVAWQDFGQWLRSTGQADMTESAVTLLTQLATMLIDEQTITQSKGEQLVRAIQDDPAPQAGNVLSFKEAQKRKRRH